MRKKWECDECHEVLPTKAWLLDHLNLHLEDASNTVQTVEFQFDELGVDPYK